MQGWTITFALLAIICRLAQLTADSVEASSRCQANRCLNGGICDTEGPGEESSCLCLTDFTGSRCTNNPCSADTCQNGGSCYSGRLRRTRCLCSKSFRGKHCEAFNTGYGVVHSLSNGSESVRPGEVSSLAFDSKADMLAGVLSVDFMASNSFEHAIKLWDTSSGALLDTLYGHNSYVLSVAFNRQGLLASGSWEDMRVWDVQAQDKAKLLRTVKRPSDTFSSVALDPDNNLLASGSLDGTTRLWNATTGHLLRTLSEPTPLEQVIISSVAFSRDGSVLASGDSSGTIRLWDVASGNYGNRPSEPRAVWSAHKSPVTSIAFDAKMWLASGSWEPDIKLWDCGSGELLRTLHGNRSYVTSVAFRGDNLLASSSWASTIELWDTREGRLLRTLAAHADNVTSLAFSDTDHLLASGDLKGSVKLWALSP